MKQARSFVSFFISYTLIFSFLSFAVPGVSAQDSKIALQRGFRTGYSDGYMSGYRDAIDNAIKSYQRHKEYKDANRAFNKDYGTIEDYSDGYRQGFEAGYDTGFEKRSFDATIPANLSRRGPVRLEPNVAETTTTSAIEPAVDTTAQTDTAVKTDTATKPIEEDVTFSDPQTVADSILNNSDSTTTANTQKVNYTTGNNDAIIVIPADTELIVELLDAIDTEKSSEGDAFKARVVSPYEISGAIIEGRVSKIQKPGRIKRRAEVLLTFDRIVLNDDRWSNYAAILTEVLPIKGDNVKRVDTEGTVEGKSSVKDDSIKIGATTGTGLVIGAIAGGPVGAAVGAGVGAAFGVGAVVIERGKHIHLKKEQQLRIKTSYNTQIR